MTSGQDWFTGAPFKPAFGLSGDFDFAFVITSTRCVMDIQLSVPRAPSPQPATSYPVPLCSELPLRPHSLQPYPHKRLHRVLQFDIVKVLGPEQFLYLEVIDQHAEE